MLLANLSRTYLLILLTEPIFIGKEDTFFINKIFLEDDCMEFSIKTYNSDPLINFDKAQADIYNSVVEKYTGNVVTEEFVKKRIKRDKFDHKGMMYAFALGNKPLAYIRYYLYPSGSLYIGFPWSTPECTADIQEKLFSELKKYLKEKFPDRKEARMGYADNKILPFHQFAQDHNLEKNGWEVAFQIDVQKFSTIDLGEFSWREAKESDLEDLIELAMEDFDFIGQEKLLNRVETEKYIIKEVLANSNGVILLQKDKSVGFASAWRNRTWNNTKFTFIKCQSIKKDLAKGKFDLYVAFAKLLDSKGLRDEKIFMDKDRSEDDIITLLRNNQAEEIGGASSYNVIL